MVIYLFLPSPLGVWKRRTIKTQFRNWRCARQLSENVNSISHYPLDDGILSPDYLEKIWVQIVFHLLVVFLHLLFTITEAGDEVTISAWFALMLGSPNLFIE